MKNQSKLSSEQLQAIESQLSCPKGEMGLDVAANMHENNIAMTRSAIAVLALNSAKEVLEIGHGNAGHLSEILDKCDANYTGLEISELMHEEAKRINANYVDQSRAKFELYVGSVIPFEAEQFDRILTVNTVYFWQQPKAFLSEIERVMKTGGLLAIAFAQKSFMQQLPFVKQKFQLYDDEAMLKLIDGSAFKIKELMHESDLVLSKAGDAVERLYSIAVLEKK